MTDEVQFLDDIEEHDGSSERGGRNDGEDGNRRVVSSFVENQSNGRRDDSDGAADADESSRSNGDEGDEGPLKQVHNRRDAPLSDRVIGAKPTWEKASYAAKWTARAKKLGMSGIDLAQTLPNTSAGELRERVPLAVRNQFHGAANPTCPEQHLLRECSARAVLDACGILGIDDTEKRKTMTGKEKRDIIVEARGWFTSRSSDSDRDLILTLAGLDSDTIITAMRKHIEANPV